MTLAVLASAPAAAAGIGGRVTLYAGGKALRASESAEAVVYFRPRVPVTVAAPAEPYVMTTRRKQFVPRVLPVTAGSTVRFPNEDPILHNAFSGSPDNAFDTGQYSTGAGASHQFLNAGLVKVYCNVHHAMFGTILVLDTPFFTRPDSEGRFQLGDLPDAIGELVVYHDRAAPHRQTIAPADAAGELAIRLDLNKRKVPPHMNKFGKPYRRDAASGY